MGGCQKGGMVDKIGEGDLEVQTSSYISHGDVTYGIRNMINNIIITLYGTDELDLLFHNVCRCQIIM